MEHHLATASAPTKDLEQMLVAPVKAIHELLRRENRVSFNDGLPKLLDSIEGMMDALYGDKSSVTFHHVGNKIEVLRRIVARSRGLLHEDGPRVSGVTKSVVISTLSRAIHFLGDRHNNEKADVSEIQIRRDSQ